MDANKEISDLEESIERGLTVMADLITEIRAARDDGHTVTARVCRLSDIADALGEKVLRIHDLRSALSL